MHQPASSNYSNGCFLNALEYSKESQSLSTNLIHWRDKDKVRSFLSGQGRTITSLTVVFSVGLIASRYASDKLEFKNAIVLMASSQLDAIRVGDPELYR